MHQYDYDVLNPELSSRAPVEIPQIRSVAEKFLKAYNASDLSGVCALMTEGAVLMPANEPPVTGIEAIRCRIESFFSDFTFCMKFEASETTLLGDRAFERGAYTAFALLRGQRGQPRGGYGEYLLLFERQMDGLWKITSFGTEAAHAEP